MEVIINRDNFKQEVLDYKGIVIVDFFGTWCMPCKMLKPTLERVAEECQCKLATIDVDDNEELAREYGIMSIPHLKIFKDGVEINSSVGLISESKLKELIK